MRQSMFTFVIVITRLCGSHFIVEIRNGIPPMQWNNCEISCGLCWLFSPDMVNDKEAEKISVPDIAGEWGGEQMGR